MTKKFKELLTDFGKLTVITLILLFGLEWTSRKISPQFFQIIPIKGTSIFDETKHAHQILAPNTEIRAKNQEFDVKYEISAQGLRDKEQHKAGEEKARFRILVLGDSFTFGMGSEYETIWPVLLEKKLKKQNPSVEVIKAGVPGYGTLDEWLLLKDLLPKYKPNLVLLTVIYNDPLDNRIVDELLRLEKIRPVTKEIRWQVESKLYDASIKTSTPSVTGNLSVRSLINKADLNSLKVLKKILAHNNSIYLRLYEMTPQIVWLREPESEKFKTSWKLTTLILDDMLAYLKANNTPIKIGFIPTLYPIMLSLAKHQENIELVPKKLKEYATARNVDFKDLTSDFLNDYHKRGHFVHFRTDGHLTPEGNEVVAESYRAFLEQEKGSVDFQY